MRFVRTIRSQLLILIAAAFVVVSISDLSQVAAVDGFVATLGAQVLEALQPELAWWQKVERSMTVLGTVLLLRGIWLPLVASNGLMEDAKPDMKTCAAFTGAAAASIYGLFHFPERIRFAWESRSQLEPKIIRYHANIAATGEIKEAAKPNRERRSNHTELSPSLASEKHWCLGLGVALSAVASISLVGTAGTEKGHLLVHVYAHE